jgi:hypothetical protein
MSIIRISDEFKNKITEKISCLNKQEIFDYFKSRSFQNLINSSKKLLKSNKYVLIKNIGFSGNKQLFELFVKQFGDYYGVVEETDIKMKCDYTGCTDKLIELHNDDAIDLENQPDYGFIQVQQEDPLCLVKNGIVVISELIRYLEVYNIDLLQKLYEIKIPMLSFGINYDDIDKTLLECKEPILYKKSNQTLVRFDLTRIKFYYKYKNVTQSKEESFLIDEFLYYAKKFRREFYLEAGDILIHNNKQTLHDRTECSFELNSDGSFKTRKIYVSFVRKES